MLEEIVKLTTAMDRTDACPSWLAHPQGATDIKHKVFANHYKKLRAFDEGETLFLARDYDTEKTLTVLVLEVEANQAKVERLFAHFEAEKAFLEQIDSPFVVKFVDMFADFKPSDPSVVLLYKILEEIDYPLYNSNSNLKIRLKQKLVVKHFNENEIIRILLNLVKFFQICELAGRKPLISNALICHGSNNYKFLVSGFEERPTPVLSMSSLCSLFGENGPSPKNGSKDRSKFNKLDIQKASHRTADSMANIDDQPAKPHSSWDEGYRIAIYYNYSISLCNGLFKDMAASFFGTNLPNDGSASTFFSQDKLERFQNLMGCLRAMRNDLNGPITLQTIEEWIARMTQCLEKSSQAFFSFKNQEVLLLNQPIFSDMRQLRLELSHDLPNPSPYFAFISKELRRMSDVESLDLLFNDCLLNHDEIFNILDPITKMSRLKRLVLKLCHNNLYRKFIAQIGQIVANRPIETFDLSLCEWGNQDQLRVILG